MTALAPTPAPEFTVHGELTPAAISAIARLLIAYARRELEAEAGQADEGQEQDEQERKSPALAGDRGK
jgi:hypothetical protein